MQSLSRESERLLSRKEASHYLGGICLTTLHRLKIPQLKIRRRVFYRIEDLQFWIAKQMVESGI
jgi:hypothetical protein